MNHRPHISHSTDRFQGILAPQGLTRSFLASAAENSLAGNPVTESAPYENPCLDESAALLAGYLALTVLSDDPRWITVVTPDAIDRQKYKALFGRNSRLRVIQAKVEDILWISWQCLAQGNSQAVISIIGGIKSDENQHLQTAAKLGDCACHLIRPAGTH